MSKKAVAEATGKELATADQWESMTGQGTEEADVDSYAIPFLVILQSGSPQVKKSSGAYIEGAEEGMVLNTVEQKLINAEAGIRLIPCYYRRAFVEWISRDSGGGYVGEYTPAEAPKTERDSENKDIIVGTEDHELYDTRYHYCLLVNDDGSTTPVVIAMTRTQVKKSKRWMSQIHNLQIDGAKGKFNPPSFSHIYTLKTIPEQKDEYSWFNWELESPDTLEMVSDDELASKAIDFYNACKGGQVKEAHDTVDGEGATPTSDAF